MSLVDLSLGPQSGSVRQPNFTLNLNGIPAANPLSIDLTANNYSEPSQFTCELAMSQLEVIALEAQASISVEVMVGLVPNVSQSLFYGLADSIEYDPVVGLVTLSGRDLAGLLIDSPTETTEANLTSSQVAQKIVAAQSAQGMVGQITTTTAPIGRYYGIDYSFTSFGQLYRATNQWDLLLFLAQNEGFEVRVQDKTLYFGPPTADTTPPFPILLSMPALPGDPVYANVESIHMMRSLTLAKDVSVTVLSWNSMLGRPIKRQVRSSNQKAPKGGFGPAQTYVFNKPDLTPEQALQYAKNKLSEITRRERILDITMPGELSLTPSSLVSLSGTGTDWDQTYYVDEIHRSLSFSGGFTQSLRLKNHSPANQAVVF